MLLNIIKENNIRTVSLIGMDKNAGKTVVLNSIIEEAYDENVRLGITSIGRDGERQDVVTMTEKPMIYAYEGTLIATAEKIYNLSEAGMEILEVTDINTSMGKIIIANVKHEGYVQIAGPASNRDIKLVSEKMLAYGCDLCLIDGALDRVSSASPAIAEGAILSTGAVLSRDMNKVVSMTTHRIELFNINEIEDIRLRELMEDAFNDRKTLNVRVIEDNISSHEIEIKTALGAGKKIADNLDDHTRYLVFHGSLVYKTLKDIIDSGIDMSRLTLVVRDATKLFIDKKEYSYLKKRGVEIKVYQKVNLLALTINPTSPMGYYFEPDSFEREFKNIIKDIPVINVVRGE